jgi:hypothetical protein
MIEILKIIFKGILEFLRKIETYMFHPKLHGLEKKLVHNHAFSNQMYGLFGLIIAGIVTFGIGVALATGNYLLHYIPNADLTGIAIFVSAFTYLYARHQDKTKAQKDAALNALTMISTSYDKVEVFSELQLRLSDSMERDPSLPTLYEGFVTQDTKSDAQRLKIGTLGDNGKSAAPTSCSSVYVVGSIGGAPIIDSIGNPIIDGVGIPMLDSRNMPIKDSRGNFILDSRSRPILDLRGWPITNADGIPIRDSRSRLVIHSPILDDGIRKRFALLVDTQYRAVMSTDRQFINHGRQIKLLPDIQNTVILFDYLITKKHEGTIDLLGAIGKAIEEATLYVALRGLPLEIACPLPKIKEHIESMPTTERATGELLPVKKELLRLLTVPYHDVYLQKYKHRLMVIWRQHGGPRLKFLNEGEIKKLHTLNVPRTWHIPHKIKYDDNIGLNIFIASICDHTCEFTAGSFSFLAHVRRYASVTISFMLSGDRYKNESQNIKNALAHYIGFIRLFDALQYGLEEFIPHRNIENLRRKLFKGMERSENDCHFFMEEIPTSTLFKHISSIIRIPEAKFSKWKKDNTNSLAVRIENCPCLLLAIGKDDLLRPIGSSDADIPHMLLHKTQEACRYLGKNIHLNIRDVYVVLLSRTSQVPGWSYQLYHVFANEILALSASAGKEQELQDSYLNFCKSEKEITLRSLPQNLQIMFQGEGVRLYKLDKDDLQKIKSTTGHIYEPAFYASFLGITLSGATASARLERLPSQSVPDARSSSGIAADAAASTRLERLPRTSVPDARSSSGIAADAAASTRLERLPRTSVPDARSSSGIAADAAASTRLERLPRTSVPDARSRGVVADAVRPTVPDTSHALFTAHPSIPDAPIPVSRAFGCTQESCRYLTFVRANYDSYHRQLPYMAHIPHTVQRASAPSAGWGDVCETFRAAEQAYAALRGVYPHADTAAVPTSSLPGIFSLYEGVPHNPYGAPALPPPPPPYSAAGYNPAGHATWGAPLLGGRAPLRTSAPADFPIVPEIIPPPPTDFQPALLFSPARPTAVPIPRFQHFTAAHHIAIPPPVAYHPTSPVVAVPVNNSPRNLIFSPRASAAVGLAPPMPGFVPPARRSRSAGGAPAGYGMMPPPEAALALR